jgi:hypothetical protein
MAYNRVNKLRYYKKIQEVAQEHYEEGVSTWRGVWKKYIYPVWPMEYNTFMRILGEGGLRTKIEELEENKEEGNDD